MSKEFTCEACRGRGWTQDEFDGKIPCLICGGDGKIGSGDPALKGTSEEHPLRILPFPFVARGDVKRMVFLGFVILAGIWAVRSLFYLMTYQAVP